jgi:hypothetical protein
MGLLISFFRRLAALAAVAGDKEVEAEGEDVAGCGRPRRRLPLLPDLERQHAAIRREQLRLARLRDLLDQILPPDGPV